MKLGLIGLGKMGGGIAARLAKAGHEAVVYDPSAEAVGKAVAAGAASAGSLEEVIAALPSPKILWLMIPQAAVEETLARAAALLPAGSIVIDGGNSNFNLSKRRGEELEAKGIHFLDVGTSGGLKGAETGYAMMIGGREDAFKTVEPIIQALAIPEGYGWFGPHGAGHFVKMVHNAIEYGMMQAIGEGFDLLKNGPYKDTDTLKVAALWNHGSIVRSFLMECVESALREDGNLGAQDGVVGDTGEGKWAVETALAHQVPFTVNSYALFSRYITRHHPSFAAKVLGAMRKQFGGHTNKERAQ